MQRIGKDTTDHKYFVMIQRYVWAKCRDPYDYALWAVIKDIAGEEGDCTLSTPDLAVLAMMSVGKVHDCRAYLLQAGLLLGDLRRDPEYPQEVWHLSIPDLWSQNVEWSQANPSIQERIAFKKGMKKDHSLRERQVKDHSPHENGLSPHENGIPPHENGIPPHETKNSKNRSGKNQEKKGAGGITQNEIRKQAEETFRKITNLTPLGNSTELGKRWYTPLREICVMCQWDSACIADVIAGGIKAMQGKSLDILSPQSILGYCNRYHASKRGLTPHGANGASLTPPTGLEAHLVEIWQTIPLDMQKYIVQNPTKTANFKNALISRGLY